METWRGEKFREVGSERCLGRKGGEQTGEQCVEFAAILWRKCSWTQRETAVGMRGTRCWREGIWEKSWEKIVECSLQI